MKTSRAVTCLLAVLLLFAPAQSLAQEPADCESLKIKIDQLEQLDLPSLSPSLRQLYKESLLKLYTDFSRCLDHEIATVTQMQRVVANTSAAPDVERRLQTLTEARSKLDAKITIVRTSLNLPDAERSSAVTPRSPMEDRREQPRSPRGNGIAPTSAMMATPVPAAAPAIQPNCAPSVAYDTAPGILTDLAMRLASDIITEDNPDKAAAAGPQMVLYTVFDAASPRSSELVQGLEAYHYLGETARTDKQLGASGNSDGAVSSIEKPGFAQLLGFAVEHGGITKKTDGTNLTLSTSLYSLYALGSKDTAERYARAGILNRVGVAATFGLENKNNELANARRNNLSEWSAKVRLYGDRSSRSPEFRRVFAEKIQPLVRERLRTLGSAIDELATANDAYAKLEDDALTTLPDDVKARMACADFKAAAFEQKQRMLSGVILGRLRTTVYQPVSTHAFELGPTEIARIEGEFLPRLKRALDNLVLADKTIKDAMDDLQKGPLATFAYTNHRIPTGSDYSETKFLFEQQKGFMGPLKLNGNLGMSFYNSPNRTLNQQRLRDLTAALSFEGTSDSPFTEAENRSKITYSFVGRYERLFENRSRANRSADIGTLQFVSEIPLFRGLSLPLSITYSTATEEEKKQGFRFNFGTRFDMDKLAALLRAASNR